MQPYFQFQFFYSEVLVVIKECKVFASKYIHTVVGHLVSRPWGPRGGAAAPSRNRVQDFPHRVHREMGANPCPQTEAGPTPPEGWGGGTGRWQVHGSLLYPATATPAPDRSRHSSDTLPAAWRHAKTCPLTLILFTLYATVPGVTFFSYSGFAKYEMPTSSCSLTNTCFSCSGGISDIGCLSLISPFRLLFVTLHSIVFYPYVPRATM